MLKINTTLVNIAASALDGVNDSCYTFSHIGDAYLQFLSEVKEAVKVPSGDIHMKIQESRGRMIDSVRASNLEPRSKREVEMILERLAENILNTE